MSFYLAVEKLALAVSALVGPEDIRERLTKALGPLTVLGSPVGGKLAAFDNRAELAADYDEVMALYSKGLGSMTDNQAGWLSSQILRLYERVRSAEQGDDEA